MARLRNRIRKADYFTDGELLRWHRDKRATYTGLWALAEDSGCLEDDPFMWKLLLWGSPLDADITVELLETWRDELVAAGKLIPYEVDGKPFLYIKTFLQHECPRNPQKNDLPLPEWLSRESVEGTSKDGKRWARHHYVDSRYCTETRYGVCTDTVDSPLPCPALPGVPKGTNGEGRGRGDESPSASPALCPKCKRKHEDNPLSPDEDMVPHCAVCGYRKGGR